MSQFIRAAALCGLLAVLSATTAGATTGPAMLGTHGTVGTGSSTSPGWAMSIAGAEWTCGVTYRFTAISTTTATIDPTVSGCTFFISGTPLGSAVVDTPCSWTLHVGNGTFNNATGATTGGTLTTSCGTRFTPVAPLGACTITFPAQTIEGVSWQNINASGANDTSATPWGSKLIHALAGLTATSSTCPWSQHGTLPVSYTLTVQNLFGRL